MSSMKVFNRVKEFFPEGLLIDQAGNCFNLIMEFPTIDGRKAGVLIWDEGVVMYYNNGSILTKKEYYLVNQTEDMELSEEFRQNEITLFSNDNIEYDDEDNQTVVPSPNTIFDNNTMIEIGKTWCKYNLCFRKALRGE